MRRRRQGRTEQYEAPEYRDLLARLSLNLRRLRDARGWTQEEAAHLCDMATPLFQRVEGMATNLTMTSLSRLCTGFKVDPRELFRPGSRKQSP